MVKYSFVNVKNLFIKKIVDGIFVRIFHTVVAIIQAWDDKNSTLFVYIQFIDGWYMAVHKFNGLSKSLCKFWTDFV